MKNLILPFVILLLFAVSCTSKAKKKAHVHGLEPISYTGFSDNLEIYVTSKPFVKGKENKLVAYVTDLRNGYSPIASNLKVIFVENGSKSHKEIKTTVENNTFVFDITPNVSGSGTLTFYVNNSEISTSSFKIYENEHEAEEIRHQDLSPSQVSFKKSQQWYANFQTKLVTLQPFREVIATSGEIKSAPGDDVIISAKSSGIVIFGQQGMVVGKPISKGANMFVISNSDISVDNIDTKFKQSKVSLDLAKTNYERNLELIKDQIISQKELLDSKAAYDNALIDYNTHAKNYSKGGIKVDATMNAYLKNLLVKEGQFVEVGTPLATISQNKRLLIEADVTQKDFSKLNTIKSATFKMAGSNQWFHTDSLNGNILSIGTSIDPLHPYIPISMEVDNIGNLISGAFIEINLLANIATQSIVVPRSALLEEQGIYSVFVQINGEIFEKREVILGTSNGENFEINQGIQPNERIVTQGVYQLKLAMASGSLPAHSHEH